MQGVLAWTTYLVREIEEPITAIRGCLDALSIEDWVEDLDPRQLNILGSIKGSTKRLLDILRELETLERDEWNTAEITLGEIDLKRTLDGVMALVRGVAEEKEVEIDIQGAEDIHELMVDERSLAQGLVYLLKSEIEASAPGDQVLVNASEATDAFIAIEIINRNRYIPRREVVTLFRTHRESTDGK
jgi:signal transduction histidine kinase